MPMKKREIDQLLKQPNIAVAAFTAPDGAPHAVQTWYEYRGGAVVFHTDTSAYKYKCLSREPRMALVVDTRKAPYKCVILKGRVSIEVKKDDARLVRMAVAYPGKKNGTAYANSMKGSQVAVVTLKPDHIVSWDYGKESP